MSIEPKTLSPDRLAEIRAKVGTFAMSPDGEALLAHIAHLEENADFHFHLISRQGRLLTGVVDAIRGEPGELVLHSHHDAVELAKLAMAVVLVARRVAGTCEEPDFAMQELQQAVAIFSAKARNEEPCSECHGTAEVAAGEHCTTDCDACGGTGWRDVKPLTTPGATLPGWEEVSLKAEQGQALNPIEALVMRLTPGDDARAQDFRRMLRAALDYTAEKARVQP